MASVQQSYEINPDIGFPGTLARPNEPHATESGLLHVPSGGKDPSPGDALYYDATENKFAVPTNAAQSLLVCGILGYRADQVAQEDSTVEFADDDEIQFFRMGTIWVVAKVILEYGDLLQWDTASPYRWDKITVPTAVNAIPRYPISCVSRNAVAVGGLAQAQIGFGRVV